MTGRSGLLACTVYAVIAGLGTARAQTANPPISAPDATHAAPRAGWASPSLANEASTSGVIYVSDAGYQVIDIFTKSIPNQLIGQIAYGLCLPTGLAVDPRGNLYAASYYAYCAYGGPSITIYQPGATRPSTTIFAGMYDPNQLAVSPADGTIYATDAVGHNVLEYAAGSTALKKIVYPLGAAPSGVALDPAGNLYATYTDTSAHVGRYNPLTRRFIDQQIPLLLAGAITFDSDGNLLVADQRTGIITVYAAGTNTPLHSFTGFSDPFTMTVDASTGTLYVADLGTRRIDELSYPDGKHLGAITGFQYNTFGLAVTPTPAAARKAH